MTDKFPPGPTFWLPFRLWREYSRDALGLVKRVAREYGDIAHVRFMGGHVVLLSHPDYVQDVLVTHAKNFSKSNPLTRAVLGNGLLSSDGDFHLHQRRKLQPLFQRDRISHYGTVMVEHADRMRQRWQAGETRDIHDDMTDLTQTIAGKTLFDTDVGTAVEGVAEAVTTAMETGGLVLRLPFAHFVEQLPLPTVRRFHAAEKQLDDIIYGMIAEHRQVGRNRGDLLSTLLELQAAEGPGGSMTDKQIRDEALTIFLAGHETTANALTWTWYLLACNPEAESQMHAEIDAVLGGRLPTPDDVAHLPYTEMVFAESMRLYPPAWLIGRRSIGEHTIGGYTFPPGTIFTMSQYVIQRDARFYSDPERFDPARMSHAAQASRHRYCYFPFSAGPRQCIGESFAWMEGVLVLATIAQRWRLRLRPGQEVVPQPMLTLRPRDGLPVTLERR
jgi:cytochrome P450